MFSIVKLEPKASLKKAHLLFHNVFMFIIGCITSKYKTVVRVNVTSGQICVLRKCHLWLSRNACVTRAKMTSKSD